MAATRHIKDSDGDSDAELMADLRKALRPLVGAKTNAVASRLALLISQRHTLRKLSERARDASRRRRVQARNILHRWDALHTAILESDGGIQERLWGDGEGLPPPAQLERAFDALRELIRPGDGGRPRQLRRALILDAVVSALKDSGVSLTKTREGDTERVAHAVVNLLGEPEVDLHRDVMAAIDRAGYNN